MLFLCFVLLLSQSLAVSASDSSDSTSRTTSTSTTTYRYFDFVRQWSPNSCYKSSHTCKQFPKEIDYWTIHGLWPSQDAAHYPADCAGTFCHFNITQISDLLDEMHLRWPTGYKGGDTKFWSHEYCKHGTCCRDVLQTEHEYFSAALQLNQRLDVDKCLTDAGITPDTDKPYTFTQLDAALRTSFGVNQATYWCRFVNLKGGAASKQLVFQISICIDKKPGSLKPIDCPVSSHPSCVTKKPFYLLPFSVLKLKV